MSPRILFYFSVIIFVPWAFRCSAAGLTAQKRFGFPQWTAGAWASRGGVWQPSVRPGALFFVLKGAAEKKYFNIIESFDLIMKIVGQDRPWGGQGPG